VGVVALRPDLVPGRWRRRSAGSRQSRRCPIRIEDIEIGGHLVPAGSVVVLMSMSANHDSAVLPDAGRFDIAREVPDGWHLLTFGGGIHYCLGANLARLELTEALAELSSRFETLALAGASVLHPPGSVIAGYSSLPISWR
jgi:cytochrome P450